VSHNTLVVSAWVDIQEGCETKHTVDGSNSANFVVSGDGHPFQFSFESESLRTFAEHVIAAIAEMDALAEKEEAEREALERAQAEEPSA